MGQRGITLKYVDPIEIVIIGVAQFKHMLNLGTVPLDVILLDFSKAFDTVPHQRLLQKLRKYGIRNHTLNWISSFLTNRTHHVVVNGSTSNIESVLSGVPQGTVLGPLLFLIYINDIEQHLTSKIRLFADDNAIYRNINCPNDAKLLQNDIDGSIQTPGMGSNMANEI